MNHKIILIYASKHHGNTYKLAKAISDKYEIAMIDLQEYGCKGYNTYGPWKIIGGMNKKHPTEVEIMSAVEFFDKLYGELNF